MSDVLDTPPIDEVPAIDLSSLEQALYDEAACIDPGDVPFLMLAICKRMLPTRRDNKWLAAFMAELEKQCSDEGTEEQDEESDD